MSRATFIASITGGKLGEFERALLVTSEYWGVSKEDILARHKKAFAIPARWDFWNRLRETGMSFAEIGRRVDRDHSTVMHGISQHKGGGE